MNITLQHQLATELIPLKPKDTSFKKLDAIREKHQAAFIKSVDELSNLASREGSIRERVGELANLNTAGILPARASLNEAALDAVAKMLHLEQARFLITEELKSEADEFFADQATELAADREAQIKVIEEALRFLNNDRPALEAVRQDALLKDGVLRKVRILEAQHEATLKALHNPDINKDRLGKLETIHEAIKAEVN